MKKEEPFITAEQFSKAAENVDKSKIKDLSTYSQYAPYSVGGADTTRLYLMDMLSTPRKTPTGINELSAAIGGGYSVGLNVSGGLPGCGKTTLCVQSALEISRAGYPSVFLSYDMSGHEIIDKVYSQVSYELFADKGYTLQDLAKRKLLETTEKNTQIRQAGVFQAANQNAAGRLFICSFRRGYSRYDGRLDSHTSNADKQKNNAL